MQRINLVRIIKRSDPPRTVYRYEYEHIDLRRLGILGSVCAVALPEFICINNPHPRRWYLDGKCQALHRHSISP